MKILVIGGTRDFGKITVRKLLERGDNVLSLIHISEPTRPY